MVFYADEPEAQAQCRVRESSWKEMETDHKRASENYLRRFEDHNAGFSHYTSQKIPWELMYVQDMPQNDRL